MTLDSPENHSELQHKQKFGGFALSVVDARSLKLTPLSIDNAVVLISEQSQLARKFKLDNFPCTRDEWYKYIFWPVHANGGDHQYLDQTVDRSVYRPIDIEFNTSPYAKLATAMRAPNRRRHGATVYPRTTKITEGLGRSINHLELRKPPRVRLRLQYASLLAYRHVIKPKLKLQCQASTVPQRHQRQISLRSFPFRQCLRINDKANQRKTHAPYAQVFAHGATVATLRPRRRSITSSRHSCVIR